MTDNHPEEDAMYEVFYYIVADGGKVEELFGKTDAALDYVREERQAGHAMPDARLVTKSFKGQIVAVERV